MIVHVFQEMGTNIPLIVLVIRVLGGAPVFQEHHLFLVHVMQDVHAIL